MSTGTDMLIAAYQRRAAVIADRLYIDAYTITRSVTETKDAKGVTVPGAPEVVESNRCRMWTQVVTAHVDRDGNQIAVTQAGTVWLPLTSVVRATDTITVNGVAYTVTAVAPVGLDAASLVVSVDRLT